MKNAKDGKYDYGNWCKVKKRDRKGCDWINEISNLPINIVSLFYHELNFFVKNEC